MSTDPKAIELAERGGADLAQRRESELLHSDGRIARFSQAAFVREADAGTPGCSSRCFMLSMMSLALLCSITSLLWPKTAAIVATDTSTTTAATSPTASIVTTSTSSLSPTSPTRDPIVIAAADRARSNANYAFFREDLEYYNANFGQYLPHFTSKDSSDDLVLVLPVSYHMNQHNFAGFQNTSYSLLVGNQPKQRQVCGQRKLEWKNAGGLMPDGKFCGFAGRKALTGDAVGLCAADLRMAFGHEEGVDLSDGKLRISFYFVWYSRSKNQPVFTGFWSNPFLQNRSSSSLPSTGHNSSYSSSCVAVGACDATCADSGGPLLETPHGGFVGCQGERACKTFATCTVGSSVIAHEWFDELPSKHTDNRSVCESNGLKWDKKSGGFCKYTSGSMSCESGRCFDRGHLVPSGHAGEQWGHSGQTFTMCNVGPQTASLNQCVWQWHEKVAACIGRWYRALILAGAVGPYRSSQRMSKVPQPAGYWKLIFLPRQSESSPGLDRDTALLWIFPNNESRQYSSESYVGRAGIEHLEADLGLRFPGVIRSAYFPPTCQLLAHLLEHRLTTCNFFPASESKKSKEVGPYTLLKECKGESMPDVVCPSLEAYEA